MYKVVWQNSQMSLKAYLIMNQSLNVIPCASTPFKLRTSGCFSHQREEVIHIYLVVNGRCTAAVADVKKSLVILAAVHIASHRVSKAMEKQVSHSRVLTKHLKLFCPEA